MQNTTNDVVSWAYVRISVRHEVAVPKPTSCVRARSRPGDDETLIRICAPSSASSCGTERCQKSSQTATPRPTPSRRDGTARSRSPAAEEPPLVEQPVRRQEQLAVDVADLAVLDERGGDRDPVVAGLLGERDDRGQAAGRCRQARQPRVVEAHRDLGSEVLEHVAREAELGEDDEVGTLRARLAEEVDVVGEVLVQLAELRRELGEGDAERRHRGVIRRPPPGVSRSRYASPARLWRGGYPGC